MWYMVGNQNLVVIPALYGYTERNGESLEDFFSCSSMPRNRELMRVFKDVGLVEQLGSGMSRILNVYDKDIFHISEHFVKVVFPFGEGMEKENTAIFELDGDENGDESGDEKKILMILEKEPDITAKKMSEKTRRVAIWQGRLESESRILKR